MTVDLTATGERHSVTTAKHIGQWGASRFETRPQEWFNSLVEERGAL